VNYLEDTYADDPRWAYFQPDEIKEITKHRRRSHIIYKGVRFEINLEIKSRTWSSSDADRKAQLLTESLDVLGVNKERLVKREYVDLRKESLQWKTFVI